MPYAVNLSDFDYDLPEGLIAQHPPTRREDSRLMVLSRTGRTIEHSRFADLGRFIRPGDAMIVNDSRVIPARVDAQKETGGRISILFLEETENGGTCLLPGRRIAPGTRLILPGGVLAELTGRRKKTWSLEASFPEGLFDYLEKWGKPPLPPYIKRKADTDPREDRLRYQTVYADPPGSVAAPTAGLHFTDEMIRTVEGRGGRFVKIHPPRGPGDVSADKE